MNIRVLCLAAAATALAAVGVGVTASSGATFTAQTTSSSTIRAAADWTPPNVAITSPSASTWLHGTTTVTAAATDQTAVGSVTIQYKAGASDWHDLCTSRTVPYSCTWDTTKVADGSYQLRATAVDTLGYSGASSIVQVNVDNTAPTASIAQPASPINGTQAITATAADTWSGLKQVEIQYLPPSGAWTSLCTRTAAPYACDFYAGTPGLNSGTYKFQAVATDNVGNTTTSSPVTAAVDSVVASIDLNSVPLVLTGTSQPIPATVSSSRPITSVTFEGRIPGSGESGWYPLGTRTSAPWTLVGDTSIAPSDGFYDLRAVLVTGGKTVTSNPVSRLVENAAPTGADVQASAGRGRIESGSRLELTYTKQIALPSILAGWDGSATTVSFRLNKGNGSNSNDNVDFATVNGAAVNLGSVDLRANFTKKSVTFAATMTAGTATVNGLTGTKITLVVGAVTSGFGTDLETSTSLVNMVWTPSGAARALNTNKFVSNAAVTESGTLDKDF